MVNIKLDDSWSLTSDSKQFMLCENGRAKMFCSTLLYAMESYLELQIRTSNVTTMKELVLLHNTLSARLHTLLAPFEKLREVGK